MKTKIGYKPENNCCPRAPFETEYDVVNNTNYGIRATNPRALNIMTGETASHIFDVPFDVEKECTDVEVIYKLGLKVILVRKASLGEVTILPKEIGCGKIISTLNVRLSDEETTLFRNTYLDTKVQVKFIMNDYSVQYSEIYPVTVEDSLEGESTPHPSVVVGFGWTED